MDVVAITRQLGAAIQEDERYKNFVARKEASENDPEVKDMMAKIEEIRTQFQAESMNASPDEKVMSKLDKDFQNVYTALMCTDVMAAYEESRQEIDNMMNYLMQILYLCVNGEDPQTCEPQPEGGDCTGSCSSCAGC
ncbi:MAG: YlbF family regulator [Oscillospiraceae bacterium]|nr:YlbF family regulator [Oscillospiraceae bacterium]